MVSSQTLRSLKLLHLAQQERKSETLKIEHLEKLIIILYHAVDFTLFSCAARLLC